MSATRAENDDEGTRRRPWYRLHRLTWLAVLLLGGTLIASSFDYSRPARVFWSRTWNEQPHWQFGWPLIARGGSPLGGVHSTALAVDILILCAFLASTAFVFELAYASANKLQWRLRSLLI